MGYVEQGGSAKHCKTIEVGERRKEIEKEGLWEA
jgi:hypothetical protein